MGIEPTKIPFIALTDFIYGGNQIVKTVIKNKNEMHQTNETQVTILTSLLRILVALSFCGYNDLGII